MNSNALPYTTPSDFSNGNLSKLYELISLMNSIESHMVKITEAISSTPNCPTSRDIVSLKMNYLSELWTSCETFLKKEGYIYEIGTDPEQLPLHL